MQTDRVDFIMCTIHACSTEQESNNFFQCVEKRITDKTFQIWLIWYAELSSSSNVKGKCAFAKTFETTLKAIVQHNTL